MISSTLIIHLHFNTIYCIDLGAFYPNYFLRSSHIDETHALKVLGGRNPYNTVYFSGMDSRQPGELYAKQIKKALSQCSEDVKVEFDHSS